MTRRAMRLHVGFTERAREHRTHDEPPGAFPRCSPRASQTRNETVKHWTIRIIGLVLAMRVSGMTATETLRSCPLRGEAPSHRHVAVPGHGAGTGSDSGAVPPTPEDPGPCDHDLALCQSAAVDAPGLTAGTQVPPGARVDARDDVVRRRGASLPGQHGGAPSPR